MNKYTFDHAGKTYTRINKAAARRAYMAGKTVFIQACNLRPFSMWTYPATASRKQAAEFALDESGTAKPINIDSGAILALIDYYRKQESKP